MIHANEMSDIVRVDTLRRAVIQLRLVRGIS